MTVRILQGDCRDVLKTLPDESVHCVVTSPPYWGLRDYGVSGQLGLESTQQEYVEKMVAVFREVRRVLRDDGTLWLNLGDTYTSTAQGTMNAPSTKIHSGEASLARANYRPITGLKPKDLVGIPWRVAFALQADGWYLRQDIIWSKPNPMPESVRDRCTKAHEYLFLFAKSERYYFDAEAIAEAATSSYDPDDAKAPDGWDTGPGAHGTVHREGREKGSSGNKARKPASARGVPVDTGGKSAGAVAGSVPWEGTTRNKRSVWTVTTQPFKEAHFATFPPALIEPCILAGCPAQVCSKCGAPWQRDVERTFVPQQDVALDKGVRGAFDQKPMDASNTWQGMPRGTTKSNTIGWQQSCACDAAAVPGVCLDPFGGAGTTGLVADRHGRDAILIELNPKYVEIARKRITGDAPLFAEVA
jgi:DNA modification methylase